MLLMFVIVMVIVAGGFKLPDQDCEPQSRQQREGKFDAIMRVKLDLRQQIAGGDAEESARRERQRGPKENASVSG